MFKDVGKVKRYDYDLIIQYKIKGIETSILFPRKKKEYYVSVENHYSNYYTDMDLTDVSQPALKKALSEIQRQYSDPEYIEHNFRIGTTLFTKKPIYSFNPLWCEECYTGDLKDNVECIGVQLVVNKIVEVKNIPVSTLKKQLGLEEYLQLKEYYTKKIVEAQKSCPKKVLKKVRKKVDKTKK